MAGGEGPDAKIDITATPSRIALRTQYREARARLMGVAPPVTPTPAAAVDAVPEPARRPRPAPWLADLISFNEELRRLFVRRVPSVAIVSAERVRAVVASFYGITVAEICGASSTRRCAWPRQVAMYICARHATLPARDIARLFGGRDLSTVFYALRAVAARAGNDPELEQTISALIAKCRRGDRA